MIPTQATTAATWGNCVIDGVPTLRCLEVLFSRILTFSSTLVILILFIMIVIGAIKYLTSGGNPEKVQEAQGTIKYALIGLLLFLGSYLILRIIQTLFLDESKASLFKFEIPEF